MQASRFYSQSITHGRHTLSPTESHHLISVLRGKIGDSVELFDGRGGLAPAVVVSIRKGDAVVEIDHVHRAVRPACPKIILAAAVAKGQRFDWMLGKCTELGVDHIALVNYERSVRAGKESACGRYADMTIAAAKQCRRLFLPAISGPHTLPQTLVELQRQYPGASLLFGSVADGSKPITHIAPITGDVVVFVGPEGGLTESEEKLLLDNRVIPVRIAVHILRTETAAVAFAAVLESLRLTPRPL